MTSATAHVDGVLVVGGGYAGVHAARAVVAEGVRPTIVDPAGTYDFVPRLAAVAAGTAPTSDATAPLAELVDDITLGSVVRVGDGEVELEDGRMLSADAVIVTAGAVPVQPPLPGIELARTLRTSNDALELRRLLDDVERVVVVGGGATGVQFAGAVRVARPDLFVSLVEMEDRVLLAMREELGEHVQRILTDRMVELHLGRQVERIDDVGVCLDGGERVAGMVVWAAGFEGRADDLGVDVVEDGRISVTDELRVVGTQRTFAAGDVALHVDRAGTPLPMSAQIAVQAGAQAGRNAAHLVHGTALQPSKLAQRGWVLDLGGGRGVAEIGPIPIAMPILDRLAPLLHYAVDLKHLQEIGGLAAMRRYRPGAARPAPTDADDALDRVAS